MRGWLLLAAGLGAACGGGSECHGWDEVEITDPDGLDAGDDLAALRAGMERFAGWTARDGTCVPEVRLVASLEKAGKPLSGRYSTVSRRIQVVAGRSHGAAITVHEFCHSLDHEEGWPSEGAAELLEPYTTGLDPDLYDTENERLHEAFANLCAAGPMLPAYWRQVEAACGLDLATEAVDFVHEVAFGRADAPVAVDTFTFTREVREVAGSRRTGELAWASLVRGGSDLYVLEYDWDEAAALVNHRIHRLDSEAAEILETLELDALPVATGPDGNAWLSLTTLVGSSEDPVLHRVAEGPALWRVRPDPLRLEAMAEPPPPDWTLLAFEHGGTAWTRGSTTAFGALDLATGELRAVEAAADAFDDEHVDEVYADEHGAVATFQAPGGMAVVEADITGAVTAVHAIPIPTDRTQALTRLPDGTLLVTLPFDDGDTLPYPLSIRIHPDTGAWSLPDGDCSSLYAPWTPAGGHSWWLDWEPTDEGWTLELVRGDLEER